MTVQVVVTPGNFGAEFDVGAEEAGKIHIKTDDTILRDPGTGEIGVDPDRLLPPFVVPTDNGKKLSVKEDGSGLEWVGPDQISPQLAPVLDNTETLPPDPANAGDSYIVPTGAQGDWAGNEGKIATWDGAAWVYYTPQCNDITTVQTGPNAGKAYKFDCDLDPDAWSETIVPVLPSTSGGIIFSSGKTIESDTGGIYIYKGDIFAWGKNNSGLNGATQENSIHSVVPSKYKMDGSLVSYEPEFVDVWYNTQNAYYLDSKGFVWAQGKNTSRQLGYSGYAAAQDLTIPTQIPFFVNGNIKVKRIVIPVGSAGTMGVFAITEDGKIYTWGENSNGQLGTTASVDVTDPTILSFTGVKDAKFSSENGNTGYVLLSDGTLWGTGLNTNGQLGLGTTANRNTWIQINSDVSNFDTFSIAVLVVKNDGTLWGCGGNAYGILGQGNTAATVSSWVQARQDAGTFVTDAARIVTNQGAGAEYAFVITTGRKIRVAGRNSQYNLGINNATQQNFYVEPAIAQAPFQGLVNEVVLTGNLNPDAYVLTTTGEVWSAGRNANGNRGIGNTTAPSSTNGLGIWTKVAYPNQIIAIRGTGLDNNAYIQTSIYALDIKGNIYTHGHQDQLATDGVVNVTVFAPMLAPVPYQRVNDDAGSTPFTGATASSNGAAGLVPAPMIADETKYLKGDGTWGNPGNTAYFGMGDPNIIAPTSSPEAGDSYLQTDDGTQTGVPQVLWTYTGNTWIAMGKWPTCISIPAGAVRTYYPATTALQERWGNGVVTPTAIAGWGFTGVGGATIVPYTSAGAMWNGYGLVTLTAPEPVLAQTFTPPTAYVRHEIAITPGADNAYFIQALNEIRRDPVMEVWICDPATGAPLPNGRLYAQTLDVLDTNANAQTWFRAPQNTYGTMDAYRAWMTFLIPQALVDANKTASNTIKLALRPGLNNGGANLIQFTGFAMAEAVHQFSYTPYLSIHWLTNETVQVSGNGGNQPTFWQDNAGIAGGYVPNNQNRTIRIPMPDTTKDIYLTIMGIYRPTDNSDGPEHAMKHSYFTIKHTSGDVALGRPRLDIYAPGSTIVEQGYRPMGWIVPATTLAAKVSTPAGSAIPYLSINIDVPQWAVNNGLFGGFITESVN